jgi:hypothetical protein
MFILLTYEGASVLSTSTQQPEHEHGGQHGQEQIHFTVDGEPYKTHLDHLTPNEIIRKFAQKDPASHYLVQIHGHERISYEGRGDIPIKLHNGMRFQVISTGPTPVSDGRR